MAEPQKFTSWWQTLPGFLTALATILTAITGLAAILLQYGVFSSKGDVVGRAQPSPQNHDASSTPVSKDTIPVATGTERTKPWSDATAVVTNQD